MALIKLTSSEINFYKNFYEKRLSDKYKNNNFFKSIFKQIFEKGNISNKQKDELDFLMKNGKSRYETKSSLNESDLKYITKLNNFTIKDDGKLFYKDEEIGKALMYVSTYKGIKNIHLAEIIINEEKRNQGLLKLFMEELIKYSETNKLIITVNPSDAYGVNRNTLIQIYKKFGFIENNYSDDNFLMDELYRLPKSSLNEEKETTYEYGCLMMIAELKSWNKVLNLIDDNDLYLDESGKYGKEKEPHVTILYGLHNDVSLEQVKDKINNVKLPIEAKIVNISIFDNKDYDVLKFEVESEELNKLNGLMEELPYTSDFPDYKPHMTIAYLKKGCSEKYINLFNFEKSYRIDFSKFEYSEASGKKTIW